MRDQEWDSSSAKLYSLHFSKLVFTLGALNSVHGKSTLGIVNQSEVLAGLFDCDHVHETSWVVGVCSDLSVDLDESLHDNLSNFTTVQSILQTVSKKDNERKAISLFVRTRTVRNQLAMLEL